MFDVGDQAVGDTLYLPFDTYDSNGASVTITGLAVTDIEIYKDGSATTRSSDSGYALEDTDGIDFSSTVGMHGFSVDLSDNSDSGFYAAGSTYWLNINAVTVDSQTVRFTYRFTIGKLLRPTLAGRTLDIQASGEVDANVTLYGGSAGTFSGGRPEVNATLIEGSDATDQIRDAVVDDATRIDASALNALSGVSNIAALVVSISGHVDSQLQGILGTNITEATGGRIAANFDTFFENGDAATASIVDDVENVKADLDNGSDGLTALKTAIDAIPTTAMRGTDNAALATVVGALADAAVDGDPTTGDTLMQYVKQLINVLVGTTGVVTYLSEAAPGNNVSLSEAIRAIHADVTGLNGDAMRGTNSAALASVVGGLADAAVGGDPTSSDTLMQYVKQLINVLVGTDGVVTYPSEAAPGNAVSLAKVLSAIHADVTGLAGNAMRGTDSAATASDVLTQINTALDTVIAELGVAQPATTPTLRTGIMLMYMALRNRFDTQTSGTDALEIYNNAGTKIAKKLITDASGDYSEAKMTSGA